MSDRTYLELVIEVVRGPASGLGRQRAVAWASSRPTLLKNSRTGDPARFCRVALPLADVRERIIARSKTSIFVQVIRRRYAKSFSTESAITRHPRETAEWPIAVSLRPTDHRGAPDNASSTLLSLRRDSRIRSLAEASFALSLPSILPVAKDLDRSAGVTGEREPRGAHPDRIE